MSEERFSWGNYGDGDVLVVQDCAAASEDDVICFAKGEDNAELIVSALNAVHEIAAHHAEEYEVVDTDGETIEEEDENYHILREAQLSEQVGDMWQIAADVVGSFSDD